MTDELTEAHSLIDALKVTRDELRADRDRWKRNAELWRTATWFAGRHPMIGFLAGIALASLVAGVW